jgi:AraC-like DNA-binding protein
MIATPGRAAVYRADRGSVMQGWGADACRVLAVKLGRLAVELELERMLGRAVRGPIAFELGMDVTAGRGLQCRAVIQALATQLSDPDPLHPRLAAPLAQSLIVAVLLSATHDYSDELESGGGPAAASTVDRAREYIEAHVADPLTAVQIADAVGVSLRSLQHGFQVTLQTTPMRYLRDLRLHGARADLLSADPNFLGVAEIAYRWGFTHLGRFAEQYRRTFGDRPSDVLRSRPSTSST